MKIQISLSLNILLCLPAVLGRRSSLDWRSEGRVEVARCRASCLASSLERCWSACDSPVSGRFGLTNRVEDVRPRRSQVWEISQPLTVTGCEVRWGEVEVSRNSYRTLSTTSTSSSSVRSVGLLLGQDSSGAWREISQTERRGVRLQPGLASQLAALRLVVVGEEGVRLVQERQLDSQTCGYSSRLTPVLRETQSEGDLLVRLSLSLAAPASEYLVRYQELPLHSSVLGSLLVSSQQFDLTLVRDSAYLIQVEDIKTGDISPPVIFHTSQETASLTLVLVTVLTTSFILLTALSFMLYLRSRRQPLEIKEELNNNNNNNNKKNNNSQISHHVILQSAATAPLHLDYNNIC